MVEFLLYSAVFLLVISTLMGYYQTSWVYYLRAWLAHKRTGKDKPRIGDVWSNAKYGHIKIIDVDDEEVEFKLIDGKKWRYNLVDWYKWMERTQGYRYIRGNEKEQE